MTFIAHASPESRLDLAAPAGLTWLLCRDICRHGITMETERSDDAAPPRLQITPRDVPYEKSARRPELLNAPIKGREVQRMRGLLAGQWKGVARLMRDED